MIDGSNPEIVANYVNLFPDIELNDKSLYVYWSNVDRTHWKENLLIYLDQIKKCDKLIMDSSCEAIPHVVWNDIKSFLYKNEIKDFIFIDTGIDSTFSYKSVYHPGFIRFNSTPILPVKKRNTLYCAFARLINERFQRVYLINELYQRGIISDGIVTCQSAEEENIKSDDKNEDIKLIFSSEFMNLLPIVYDGIVNKEETSKEYSHIGSNCIINIVMESSYDISKSKKYPSMSFNGGHGWDRPFVTEKTIKAFNGGQIPVFLSVPGYASIIRSMGFDIFDDIIDHSYDNEKSPDKRISMIADEILRLKKIGIDHLKNIKMLDERFSYNKSHLNALEQSFVIKYNNYIRSWFYN